MLNKKNEETHKKPPACKKITILRTPTHSYKKGELVSICYNLYNEILVNGVYAEEI